MTYSITTNIKHLISNDMDAELPSTAQKLKDFLGTIIMVATTDTRATFIAPVKCRKRVNRAICLGLIGIKRQDIPQKMLLWHCSACEDGGIITNWEKTHYDMTKWAASNSPSEQDPELSILVSLEEIEALRAGKIYDADCDRMIYGAQFTPQSILIKGRESDFDNFIGFVAADANHERKAKRSKLLDAVFAKASDALDDSLLRSEA